MNDELAIGYWHCVNSIRRYKIVMTLGDEGYLTPSILSEKTEISVSHMSNLLKDLKKYNIVVCINEEERRNRLYKLTNFGEQLLPYLRNEKKITE